MTEDPVARYKALLSVVSEAAQRMTEKERQRTLELVDEIADAKRAITEATEAEEKVKEEITAWWRQVSAKLVGLRWIPAGRQPGPDPTADPAQLSEYLAEVEPATNKLFTALRKASWRGRPS